MFVECDMVRRAGLGSFLVTLLLAVMLVGLFSFDAEARRLGGGRSFGRQSPHVTQRAQKPPVKKSADQSATQAGTAAARNPARGILGGLAAGLGLAWLAHALGLGPEFANMLLIGLLALIAIAVIRGLSRARLQGQGAAAARQDQASSWQSPPYNPTKVGNDASARPWESAQDSMIGSALQGKQGWGIPDSFDVQGFLDSAKRNFIQLQAAWDKGDLTTLRAMMTDEVLAEMKRQLAERESAGRSNQTEVASLEAQLLGIEETDKDYLASVEFSGMIREEAGLGLVPFHEVWNMSKPRDGSAGWLVAGIQGYG